MANKIRFQFGFSSWSETASGGHLGWLWNWKCCCKILINIANSIIFVMMTSSMTSQCDVEYFPVSIQVSLLASRVVIPYVSHSSWIWNAISLCNVTVRVVNAAGHRELHIICIRAVMLETCMLKSHNAPVPYLTKTSFYNRNVHTCAHFCYKMAHCVICEMHCGIVVRLV